MTPSNGPTSPSSFHFRKVLTLTLLLSIFLSSLFTFFLTANLFKTTSTPTVFTTTPTPVALPSAHLAKRTAATWLHHLLSTAPSGKPSVSRIGCREYEAGAQTCVYEGFICLSTRTRPDIPTNPPRVHREPPTVYFLDDTVQNGAEASSDQWCQYRDQSSDPRYYASRHWPILQGTFSAQQSCLSAYFRTTSSLLGVHPLEKNRSSDAEELSPLLKSGRVKWLPSIWLVDLDYVDNDHNNHLLMDIVWLLDAVLFQRSLEIRPRPGLHNQSAQLFDSDAHLFSDGPRHVYLPQGEADFVSQTGRDVNRLMYALVLELNLSRLYPTQSAEELHAPPEGKRWTKQFLDAYPALRRKEQLLFHHDILKDKHTDLVCTPRLTVGAKVGNGAHERVCRSLRERGWKLFGMPKLPMRRLGQILYPQPPKRIVILQRHLTRRIANLNKMENGFRAAFEKHGVEVEIVTTEDLETAEEYVRVFSRAGVLITPHGSQAMGQIWMPRYSALIEVMPVGYVDYAFNLLAESCKLWYYELQSMRTKGMSEEFYEKACGHKKPHMLHPCTDIKSVDVTVNVTHAIATVRFALERIGYSMDPWMEYVQHG